MLALSTIQKSIQDAVRRQPERVAHGYTAERTFYVLAETIRARGGEVKWKDRHHLVSLGKKLIDAPDNVAVHSHSAENYKQWWERTGQLEPFVPFSWGDIKVLKRDVYLNVANTAALIMADGRMETLYVPDKAREKFLALGQYELQALIEGTAKEKLDTWQKPGADWWDISRIRIRVFADKIGLVYREDRRWKPKEKTYTPMVPEVKVKKKYVPRQIYIGEPSHETAAYRYYTSPYFSYIPPELWPVVPVEAELFRKGWEQERVQMRFFGFSAAPKAEVPRMRKASKAALKRMESRLHTSTGTTFLVDWQNPQKSTEWYGRKYSQRRTVTMYPLYRTDGQPLYWAKKDRIQRTSEPAAEPGQLPLFGGLGGRIAHCGAWVIGEWGRPFCIKYAPACKAQEKCLMPIPPELAPLAKRAREYFKYSDLVDQALQDKFLELEPDIAKYTSVATILAQRGYGDGRTAVYEFWKAVQQQPIRPGGRTWTWKPKKGQIKACVDHKSVWSEHYGKKVLRCSRYTAVCTPGACLPEPMIRPEPAGKKPSQKEIRDLAHALAEEFNILQAQAGPWVAREILERGGIAPYKKGYLKEEYKEIPLHLKNRSGLRLDEMASEMGVDEAKLITIIQEAYPKGRKTVRVKAWKDFEDNALDILHREAMAR